MYAAIGGVALAIIAKAGTQSFKEAGAVWYINNQEALVYPQRIFFIRNPFERLESCYSFFVGLKNAGTRYDAIPDSALTSWEAFIDHILINSDEHWNPQINTLMYKGEPTPTKIMRFEDVTKWWPLFFSKRLPHNNQSDRLVTTSYRGEEIQAFYAQDYDVWSLITPFDDIPEAERAWPLQ